MSYFLCGASGLSLVEWPVLEGLDAALDERHPHVQLTAERQVVEAQLLLRRHLQFY